jgi:DNA invertase Pin-like site-specific DNA recombinase
MAHQIARHTRRIALYRRYSTEEQRQKSHSAEMQDDECRKRLAERHGDAPLDLTYYDDFGISGAVGVRDPNNPRAEYRPALTQLIEDIADGKIDEVVVYAQDRLARDEYLWHFLNTMIFRKYEVPVIFARDHHDLSTDEGQMLSSFHAMAAQLERRKISKNVSAATKRRLSEGYINGKVPFGWQHDPDQVPGPRVRRRLIRNEAEAAALMDMFRQYMSGWATLAIVRDLQRRGVPCGKHPPSHWTTDAVLRVLRNPIHCGLVRYKDEYFPGAHAHLAYWSEEDHQRLQQKMGERTCKYEWADRAEQFFLSRLIFCGHCGRVLVGSRNVRTGVRCYHCRASIYEGRPDSDPNLRQCPGLTKEADELERVVVNALRVLANSEQMRSAAEGQLQQALHEREEQLRLELEGVGKDLRRLDDGFTRLYQRLDARLITETEFDQENQRRRELQEGLIAREAQLQTELTQKQQRQFELAHAVTLLRDFDQLWDTMPAGERREFLRQIDPHMTLTRDGVDAVLRITPGFADPIVITMPCRNTKKRGRRKSEDLTPRHLAMLALWKQGLRYAEIARQWDIAVGTVEHYGKQIRAQLKVGSLDDAVDLMADRLAQCELALPTEGRAAKRPKRDPNQLTEPLLDILKLLAQGQGCMQIAAALAKDKSTISRQTKALCSRLGVTNTKQAVERGRELGLID